MPKRANVAESMHHLTLPFMRQRFKTSNMILIGFVFCLFVVHKTADERTGNVATETVFQQSSASTEAPTELNLFQAEWSEWKQGMVITFSKCFLHAC